MTQYSSPGNPQRRLSPSRREFLHSTALSSLLFVPGIRQFSTRAFDTQSHPPGKRHGVLEFLNEGPGSFGVAMGTELDERVYTDLSQLSDTKRVTPTKEFYVRSGASQLLPDPGKWIINVNGMVEHPFDLTISKLQSTAKPIGLHLMECAGNTRAARFGLISVASWTGVPLSTILEGAKLKSSASRILISGFDQYANPSATSIPGASWIFHIDELRDAGAFLALTTNGQPLTRDHGAPVRLVVPGWYGCCCIKWITGITACEDAVDATSQMQEYASRTLQDGIPDLAKDFRPAIIESAAMPVRVERWLVNGKPKYRVIGILWGGSQLIRVLQIRFSPDEPFLPVTGLRQTKNDPWTIWTYGWSPTSPGVYSIQLKIADPPVIARKLDAGYYVRSVRIDHVS